MQALSQLSYSPKISLSCGGQARRLKRLRILSTAPRSVNPIFHPPEGPHPHGVSGSIRYTPWQPTQLFISSTNSSNTTAASPRSSAFMAS